MLLENRIAFVTAAGAGIGRAGAIAMAAEGAIVMVTDLDEAAAKSTADEILAKGFRAYASVLDVTDDAALTREIGRAHV